MISVINDFHFFLSVQFFRGLISVIFLQYDYWMNLSESKVVKLSIIMTVLELE